MSLLPWEKCEKTKYVLEIIANSHKWGTIEENEEYMEHIAECPYCLEAYEEYLDNKRLWRD